MKPEDFITSGVFYEPNCQYIMFKSPEGIERTLLELRGWGAIQNLFKIGDGKIDLESAARFQDELGHYVANLINTGIKALSSGNPYKGVSVDDVRRAILSSAKATQNDDSLTIERIFEKEAIAIIELLNNPKPEEPVGRFKMPTDNELFDIAVIFKELPCSAKEVSDMINYTKFILNRILQYGDLNKPTSKEIVKASHDK